ncbi:hypothetical protein H17ap60334_00435 [Thermosipho africanus H17ap60334]|uniref:TM0106 family RecB-like putative nuclease n=1 Tax=Thermosipho africanus TaxID=2421 RepID=UPI00028C86F4|nr:TM0106 family RecB-like putative nuclease [Thermosipho africanus]EKF50357.1 hypothetical protein H17ap60334_00435 [Thermosipho africanus H17ap60334]
MNIEISNIRTVMVCPRKFWLESREKRNYNHEEITREVIRFGGSLKYAELSSEIFGATLWATGIEINANKEEIIIISWRKGKRLYKYHYYEAALYGYVFSKESGKKVRVIFKSNFYEQEIPWENYVESALVILRNLTESDMPTPKINSECKFCAYSSECTDYFIKSGNIEFIKGIGKINLNKLKSGNIKTLTDIVRNREKVQLILGEQKGLKVWAQAKAFLDEKPVLIKKPPKLKDGLFFDIESYLDFHYLFGILYKDKYIPFIAREKDFEKEAFIRLLLFLSENDLPIYHYHSYEPNQFKKLLRKYGLSSSFESRFLDIYSIFTNHIAVPVLSYSLKPLARYFGFNWRTNLNGMKAVKKFEDFLQTGDEKLLDEILIYNEDDVRATKLLLNILNDYT